MKRNFKVKTTIKHTKPALVALIKKTIKTEAETKSFINSAYTHTGTSDLVHVSNLIAPMTQGVGEGQYIGEKMFIKNINFKAVISRLAANGSEDLFVRVLIIKTKEPITNTSINGATYTDIFRGSATAVATVGMVDLNKVTLVYDKLVHVDPPTISGALGQKAWSYNLKLNKKVTWDQSNSNYLKDGNYYIVTVPQNPSNSISNCFWRLQYTINFKDL